MCSLGLSVAMMARRPRDVVRTKAAIARDDVGTNGTHSERSPTTRKDCKPSYQPSMLPPQCECKSQVSSGGDVIFGAAMHHRGTFGWCKYAPAVSVECPQCCQPASPKSQHVEKMPAHELASPSTQCECKSQTGNNGDLIFGATMHHR